MVVNSKKNKAITRKTVVISEDDYKYIISLVYKKKVHDSIAYTQQEALSDIIKQYRQNELLSKKTD